MVSERYLGTAEDIEAAMAGSVVVPERTRHLAFGAVAAGWSMLTRLRVIEIVDEVVGPRRADAGASVGTYLALAALNRLVDPCAKRGFTDWWAATAADRFTGIRAGVLDHRRFWDATRTVTAAHLAEIERRVVTEIIATFDLDISAVALDMTNFATFIDSGNDKASLAQRGKAKQKRADLRLIGLGLVVTPRRRNPAAVAHLPGQQARRNPVRHDAVAAVCPLPRVRHHGVDTRTGHRGLRCRTELHRQLRRPAGRPGSATSPRCRHRIIPICSPYPNDPAAGWTRTASTG
jgi:hypothetical protein